MPSSDTIRDARDWGQVADNIFDRAAKNAPALVYPAIAWAAVGAVAVHVGLHGMHHNSAMSWLGASPVGLVAGSALRRAAQWGAAAIDQTRSGNVEWSRLGKLARAHACASAGLYAEALGWFFVKKFWPTAFATQMAFASRKNGLEELGRLEKNLSGFADGALFDVGALGRSRDSWKLAESELFRNPALAARAFMANPFDPRWPIGPANLPLDKALARAEKSWQATVSREDQAALHEAIDIARALREALELRAATQTSLKASRSPRLDASEPRRRAAPRI